MLMRNMQKETRLVNTVEVCYVPVLKNTIQVVVNGKDMYFEESEFVSCFKELGKLWRKLDDRNSSREKV